MKLVTTGVLAMVMAGGTAFSAEQRIDLSGPWAFQLDGACVGEREKWFAEELEDEILLPGSTDERGFGPKPEVPWRTRLTREHRHMGPAWYQKVIEIPDEWIGRRLEVFLERAMWETKLWVDDHYVGMADSLCVPHRFDISDFVDAGAHRLTLMIDNRLKINVGHDPTHHGGWYRMDTMALTDESQTAWNGVIGRLEIRVSDPVWIERIEAHPDLERRQTRVVAHIRSSIGAFSGELRVLASCADHTMGPVTKSFSTTAFNDLLAFDEKLPLAEKLRALETDPLTPALADVSGAHYKRRTTTIVSIDLPFGEGAKLWDEFSPSVYRLTASLSVTANDTTYQSEYSDTFGLRRFEADGVRFKLNGRTVFLRGNQDNCVHPRTGYPPMSKDAWLSFLRTHQDYGLNHLRFHSWCPPKAAFQAADELGMIFQVECPLWDINGEVGYLPERASFIRYEAERILDEYGNHPSFCLMSMGNELYPGATHYLQYLVEVLRRRDNRHLYACTSHPYEPERNDDFFVGADAAGGAARGLEHKHGAIYFNYEDTVGGVERPFIAHEIGQHTSFPDFYSWFNEGKYTGPLKAHYIGIIQERFERFHPPERGPEFARASGALQVLLYKAEIEAMLRTPSMDGFHLNGLMDYPGEGVALIGVLDAMGDSKGLITPKDFRRFSSETVALVAMKEYELTGGSLFEADAMLRHHGPADIDGGQWLWSIADFHGKTLIEGDLGQHHVATGGLTPLGKIEASLPNVSEAREFVLTLRMAESDLMNEWSFWLFPAKVEVTIPEGVMFADAWTGHVQEALQHGGTVLLALDERSLVDPVPCHFWTVFWGRGLFSSMPRPMGIFCDPTHPALDGFPTREHSQFQWYSLMTGSFAMNLNGLPFDFEPVVYMIDDFNECERLGLVLEARVGKGRLVATSLNLGTKGNRTPAQQQMLKSLLDRVQSSSFDTAPTLEMEELKQVFDGSGT